MRLNCPDCTAAIQAENVNIEKVIAKCDACDNVFKFDKQVLEEEVALRPEVDLPLGVEVFHFENELEFQLSWRDRLNGFLVFFAMIWNGILFPVAFFAIMSGEYIMLIFMSLHLLVGVGLLYWILTTIFNTTYIIIDDEQIHIEHRPLKWFTSPNRNIPATDIDQIFVKKYKASETNGKPDYAYSVDAVLNNESHIPFIRGLTHPDQALYVEQETEIFLKIKDKPVEEEWKG